jgi:hypothetical protein
MRNVICPLFVGSAGLGATAGHAAQLINDTAATICYGAAGSQAQVACARIRRRTVGLIPLTDADTFAASRTPTACAERRIGGCPPPRVPRPCCRGRGSRWR